uniref:Uncharacterized protein n=1 Tax=Minutocellus polymorphus TaxID=265543 RepID=A0A7S0AG27_9STRA|mmetsp:Transcript_12592/g.20965  ORF Transcript_12592/g.20965 Transcript_12592/m.20965 type:complete len:275 (+) Transcript_12592:44-868(+)
MSDDNLLLSAIRAAGRYFTITALILQIIGLWGCHFFVKNPYGLLTSFRRHAVPDGVDTPNGDGGGGNCQTFGATVGAYEGISLNDGTLTDSTYEFAKWMTYISTVFGLVAVFSDCTVLTCCPCEGARSRPMQIRVLGGLQMAVGAMLALSFTVMKSAFCTNPWPDLEDAIADAGAGGAVSNNGGSPSCSLAWGGVCVVVATALWIAAAFMTLGKGRTDRLEEAKKEQLQADAEAQRTLRKEGKEVSNADADADDGGDGERKKEAAATNEEIEGI